MTSLVGMVLTSIWENRMTRTGPLSGLTRTELYEKVLYHNRNSDNYRAQRDELLAALKRLQSYGYKSGWDIPESSRASASGCDSK